jgi:hypothetical protein
LPRKGVNNIGVAMPQVGDVVVAVEIFGAGGIVNLATAAAYQFKRFVVASNGMKR